MKKNNNIRGWDQQKSRMVKSMKMLYWYNDVGVALIDMTRQTIPQMHSI